jgi:sugar (pentulose or hexulose) kinase
MSEGGARDLGPKGEPLRRALRWLDERAREEPKQDRAKLIEEAGRRFDLSPIEEDFLLANWVRPTS